MRNRLLAWILLRLASLVGDDRPPLGPGVPVIATGRDSTMSVKMALQECAIALRGRA